LNDTIHSHLYPHFSIIASPQLPCPIGLLPTSPDCSPQHASLEHYSGYTGADLKDTVQDLQRVLHAAQDSKEQAVRRKFAASKYWRVSQLPELAAFCAGRQSAV